MTDGSAGADGHAPARAGAQHPAVDLISVMGFRTVRHAELRGGPVTALVGEASAGKSNLLAAIALLTDGDRPIPMADDVSAGASFILVDAATSTGPVRLRYERTAGPSRHGGWPVVFLPAALRDGIIVGTAGPASEQSPVAAVAEALREQAAHGDSRSSRANGLVAAVENCCESGVRGVLLLVEEPELYLRPQAQRYLYRLLHRFAVSGNQVIYTTHAPAFLNVARLAELAVVSRDPEAGTVVHPATALPASEGSGP